MPQREPRSAGFRAVASLLLVIAGTSFTVFVAECATRLVYRKPWYEKLVGDQNRRLTFQRNRHGLRDREIVEQKAPNERRILVLGDSFTFGKGVEDGTAVFPELLERRLDEAARLQNSGSVDVLNGGIPGSLTADWLALWDQISPIYRPDALLIVFFLRDGTRTGSIPEFFGKIREEIVLRNQRSVLYRHSFLFRMFRDSLDQRAVSEQYTRTFMSSYFGDETQTSEWRLAQQNLTRLRDLARERSIPIGLVIFPILVELDSSYPFRTICDLIAEFAKREGIPVHNLLPAFLGQDAPTLWVSAFDQHPNARGHQIAADSILPFLRGLTYPDEARRSQP
jgi:lysophospholipase L1-like esterase